MKGWVVGLLLLTLSCVSTAQEKPAEKKKNMDHKYTNRLAKEKSPYLLQHAHNPVDWYPWGQEAFDKAKKEDKPIFLSIGYSTCHWCHVMERESFEDEEVAKILNEHFVCIKVDREERPDVDQIYMAAVQAIDHAAAAGPSPSWLTPDLKPFIGGTYFPKEDRFGRPGFKSILTRIDELWKTKRGELVESGRPGRRAHLKKHGRGRGARRGEGRRRPRRRGHFQMEQSFEPRIGGFAQAAQVPALDHDPVPALRHHARTGHEGLAPDGREVADRDGPRRHLRPARRRLRPLFDRHACGSCPHFEKMLYDNALLTVAYLEAWQLTKKPSLRPHRPRDAGLRPPRHDVQGGRVLLRRGRRQRGDRGQVLRLEPAAGRRGAREGRRPVHEGVRRHRRAATGSRTRSPSRRSRASCASSRTATSPT